MAVSRKSGRAASREDSKDILMDVYVPALDEQMFTSGLFVLCRYSLQPFAVGMLASGIQGWMFAFEKGDCMDYKTWLQADRGIKDERTEINEAVDQGIKDILASAANESTTDEFEKRGNVFHPHNVSSVV